MASQIVEFVNSIMTKVSSIPYTWSVEQPDQTKLFQWVAIWNNQPRQWKEGKTFPVCKPACFIELEMGDAMNMGLGITLYQNVKMRFHIVDWQFDAGNGTIDQNIEVYAWRDLLKSSLEQFFPLHGGCITQTNETQDYEHTDVYHYIVDFIGSMTDLKGSILDPDQTAVIKQPTYNVYDPTASYVIGDHVLYDSIAYVCDTDTPVPAGVFDSNLWEVYQWGFNPTINMT